jgi:predicted dehydrogenase
MKRSVSRRKFLKDAAVSAVVAGAPMFVPARALGREGFPGANEQIVIGFIGCGGRARQLMDQVPEGGRVVASCDCNFPRAQEVATQNGRRWNAYRDYRKMFDNERLDAVFVVTPDHARTLPAIHAVQAGYDVYAEKPLTAYVREGRVLVDHVRKNKRIFQVGSQQRSMEINRFCCEFVRDGKIGKLKRVQGVCYPGPRRYEGLPEETVPAGDDWETWQGPTSLRPFNNSLQFGWMQWWDYSGGEMTNWGAHGVDQIQWALGKSLSGPLELWPDTPGPNGKVSMRYDANGPIVSFELESSGPMGGGIFIGDKCKMEINRNKFATNPRNYVTDAPSPAVQGIWEGDGWIARPHIQNWLDCIKTRKLPNADVEIGHRSISTCHLLNITRELGRRLTWDPDKERFVNDNDANKLLDRPRRAGFELPAI